MSSGFCKFHLLSSTSVKVWFAVKKVCNINQVVEVDFSKSVWKLSLDRLVLPLEVGHRVLRQRLQPERVERGQNIYTFQRERKNQLQPNKNASNVNFSSIRTISRKEELINYSFFGRSKCCKKCAKSLKNVRIVNLFVLNNFYIFMTHL